MTDQHRIDNRGEWFREWDSWSCTFHNPPRWYWLGMAISALWIAIYLLIYPSIPLVGGYWQGMGVPGGCQPWTAICELQQGEEVVDAIRGHYLHRIRTASVQEIAADAGLSGFIQSAGRVRFGDHCAGCHGKHGARIVDVPDIAPALNDDTWLHGGDVLAIWRNIQNPIIHPFGWVKRNDELSAKILAVYVYRGMQ